MKECDATFRPTVSIPDDRRHDDVLLLGAASELLICSCMHRTDRPVATKACHDMKDQPMENESPQVTDESNEIDSSFKPFSGLSGQAAVQNDENPASRRVAQIIFIAILSGVFLYMLLGP